MEGAVGMCFVDPEQIVVQLHNQYELHPQCYVVQNTVMGSKLPQDKPSVTASIRNACV